jgi:adenylate cyclase
VARQGAPIAGTLITSQHVALAAYAGVAALALFPALRRVLVARGKRARAVSVAYHPGPTVEGAVGATLLDVSRRHAIPHSAVCAGHARCGTCRVRVLAGGARLSPPRADEIARLAHLGFDAGGVRLACQAIIAMPGKIEVERLVPVEIAEEVARGEPLALSGEVQA